MSRNLAQVDASTLEIIRHKLHAVVEEAIISLENVSGSPITNEGHDMSVSIYTRNGALLVGGVGYVYTFTSASQAVKHIMEVYGADIKPDDAFLLNDPYVAALHCPDMYVVSPIHYRGSLVGFVSNFVHLTDIGGITPGGFCPTATDSFQEGLAIPGLKVVDAGVVRTDVLQTVLNNVRDPGATLLDLKSQLAANFTAKTRVAELHDEFGEDLIEQVSETLIRRSELQLRRRLAELPDGSWSVRQYIDSPTGVATVILRLEKSGDSLLFDLSGTDRQLTVGLNATYWGTWGGIFGGVFPLLGWDLDWNDGIIKPISLVAPAGSLVNCTRPAPTSIATVALIKVVGSLASLAVAKMLRCSEAYADRASGIWKGIHMNMEVFGRRSEGEEYFVTLLTDSFAGAGGARAGSDGIDLGGETANQVGRWANSESQELNTPLLYLFRRPLVDSGGPGKYRGGVSHEYAVMPHRSSDGKLGIGLFGLGISIPFSHGMSGGYPGSHASYTIFREAARGETPASWEQLQISCASVEEVTWGHYELDRFDVIVVRGSGGGGYGDPLERDPRLVARDVSNGLVSDHAAAEIYGVRLRAKETPDLDATLELRSHLRALRLGATPSRAVKGPSLDSRVARPLSEYLAITPSGTCCTRCGYVMGVDHSRWKGGTVKRISKTSVAGAHRRHDMDVVAHGTMQRRWVQSIQW